MTKYSVAGPDGARYRIEGPEGMSDAQVIAEIQRQLGAGQQGGGQPAPEPPPQSWGEYARGLGREALQGATFGFADELGLTDRAASERFGAQYPIASTLAHLAGGVAPFVAGPGAAVARLAIGRTLPRTIVRSAGVGAGAGALSGAGAGEGDIRTSEGLESRLESARMGGLYGAGIGAAAPPVIGALGMGARAVGSMAAPLTRSLRTPSEPPLPFSAGPRSAPIEGARFVNEMPSPGEIASAQTQGLELIRDQLLRSGRSVQEVEGILGQLQQARTYHSSGAAQDVTALADLEPGLQRLAGTMARQSPEAARMMSQFLQARQTGTTPQGADAGRLAQVGLPTRERFAPPMTGRQTEVELGSTFGAGQTNVVPMGHRERVLDGLKRAFRIKDSDYHGHAGNAQRTEAGILAAARAEAQGLYGAAYKAGEGVDLRPAIQPIMDRWTQRMTEEPEPVARAIRSMLRLFQTRTGTVAAIERFDKAKQFSDGLIERWIEAPEGRNRYVGGLLGQLRSELVSAVDAVPSVGPAYQTARAAFSDRMRARDILTRFRDAWKEEADVTLADFNALSDGERRLARLGLLWGAEKSSVGTDTAQSILRLFRTPRAQELLSGAIGRTARASGEFANRPERFGQYMDFERLMPETRQTALGGSQTAERVQDDLMTAAMQASQNLGRLRDMFTGNQSIYQLGERVVTWVYDRAFGVGADTAREVARMLFTAAPAEREAVLRQLAAIMPVDRMARFNELLRRVGGASGGSAAGAAAGASQGGPVSL